jgi:CYTH domain-containing protein
MSEEGAMIAAQGLEVERKFLLEEAPDDLDQSPRTKIRQGYLAVTEGGTEVRIRKEGRRRFLTIKDGGAGSGGVARGETEVEITAGQFDALWPLTKGRRVRKVRHELAHEGTTVTIDVYRGRLKGLVVAEVEFPDEDAARGFQPPEWLGREVTGDEHYRNRELACHGLPEVASH